MELADAAAEVEVQTVAYKLKGSARLEKLAKKRYLLATTFMR